MYVDHTSIPFCNIFSCPAIPNRWYPAQCSLASSCSRAHTRSPKIVHWYTATRTPPMTDRFRGQLITHPKFSRPALAWPMLDHDRVAISTLAQQEALVAVPATKKATETGNDDETRLMVTTLRTVRGKESPEQQAVFVPSPHPLSIARNATRWICHVHAAGTVCLGLRVS